MLSTSEEQSSGKDNVGDACFTVTRKGREGLSERVIFKQTHYITEVRECILGGHTERTSQKGA